MKLILLLICGVGLLSSIAEDSYAQTARLTLNMKDATVKSVLEHIENNTEFSFMYENNVFDANRKVDIRVREETIDVVLDRLLDSETEYRVVGRHIILFPAEGIRMASGEIPARWQQQEGTVSGVVTDSQGSPLPGVTIVEKGTTKGVITDGNGEYSISDLAEDATLVYSFVGMQSQEIVVGDQTTIDVTMEEDVIGIEEVVAIGYGTARKSDLTGSVARVDVEELSELSNVSAIQSLQSNVPGLNVGAIERPGQNPTINIRGQATLSSGSSDNAPLIVVDGTIYRGSLIDINPNDIESVDVLKDASSAAIYGSQASNGVMLITTKKGGLVSKPVISYSGSYSVETPSNEIRPMRAPEYEEFFRDALWNISRLGPDYIQENPDFVITSHMKTNEIVSGYRAGLDTDWWGEFTGNGSIQKHNLSLRGKTKDLSYFISGGYTDVEGFVVNDNYARYNMRINAEAKINSWMDVGIESFYTSSDYSGYAPSISNAFHLQPWAPVRDDSGELILRPEGSMLNPYAQLEIEDAQKNDNLFGNIYANLKLPVKGLSYKFNFAQNYRTSRHNQYNPYGANETGYGYKNTGIGYDWQSDNIINFQRQFGIHNINATLVYGVEKRTGENTNNSAENFTDGSLGFNRLQAGTSTLNSISTGAWEESSLYSMGRVIYNLKDKYLATGTVRRDGFSGFGQEEKIGVFPSAALAWIPTEESFLKEQVSWLQYLKIRASYGSTGRRAVSRYQTLARMSRTDSYVFGEGGGTEIGQYISSMANSELGWETTTGLNVGVDFSIIDSRIYGNVEYYNNDTKNILYNIQLPQMTGFGSIPTNIGKVHNHGIEFAITGDVIRSRDLNWKATVNFTRNRNEIVSILGFDNDGDGKEDDLVANRLFIGEPQRVIYNYEITGMWQLADEEAGIIPSGFYPGVYKIADLNEDGAYSASDDRKILGYMDPSYQISLVNNVSYKNFDLYMLINTIQGGKDYYWGDDDPQNTVWRQVEQLKYVNAPEGAWDYWLPENPDAYYRRLDRPASYQALRYSQRNFVRLQDLSISYTFDKALISKFDIGGLKLFISGKNLITLTNWKGWDPETGRNFSAGYPLMKNYTFGVNVEF